MRSALAVVDGSPFGEHALPLAAEIAPRAGAAWWLLSVLPTDELAQAATLPRDDARRILDQRRQLGAYLDGLALRLTGIHPLPCSTGTTSPKRRAGKRRSRTWS